MTAKVVFLRVKYPSTMLKKGEIDRDLEFDRLFNNACNGWKYIPSDSMLGGM